MPPAPTATYCAKTGKTLYRSDVVPLVPVVQVVPFALIATNPPAPTAKLRDAFARHNQTIQSK